MSNTLRLLTSMQISTENEGAPCFESANSRCSARKMPAKFENQNETLLVRSKIVQQFSLAVC